MKKFFEKVIQFRGSLYNMRHRILSAITLPIISFILAVTLVSSPVHGKEPRLPHLIQTVSERDIFEGMLALGLMEAPVLKEDDCEKAYENVKLCIVRINMKNAHGSGIIWEITPENIIIVTNKHVLDYWDGQVSNVRFPQGYYARAGILGISEEYDIAFLTVDNTELDYTQLKQLRYVHRNLETYRELQEGDELFCVGAKKERAADSGYAEGSSEAYCQGSIGNMWQYIDEFGEYMIYGYGYGVPGMSGGGTFDAKGNLIGMISGGTENGEIASVPLTLIIEAYERLDE